MRKKITIITFLSLFSLALFGCGKKSKTTTQKKTTTNVVTTEHVHEFGEWQETVKATCSEEGFKKRKCSCGLTEFEIIPKLPHNYVNDKCSVCGHEKLTEGFHIYYSEEDSLYHIDDYTGTETTVRIPRYYDDGENGEHNIYFDLISVNETYESKLKDCNIKKIIIGDGFQTIDDYMFVGLSNLEELVIESSVKKIGDNTFYNCSKLSTVTFNEDLEQIGFYAFGSCDIKEIRLPYDLKVLGVGAFANNTNLTSVSMYNNIIEINNNAFNETALTSIKIPYSVNYFGPQAHLPNLTTFNIDARNTIYTFEDGCLINQNSKTLIKAIGEVIIPSDIVYIDSFAFAYLDYSEIDFVIPNSVKKLGFSSFYESKLKSLTLSNSLLEIGENAFTNLEFEDNENLVIELPSTLTTISYHAFQSFVCKKLVIPSSVTKLDYSAFEDCLIEEIEVYQSTLNSPDCNRYWNYGIDTDYTTITIIED